MTGEKRTLIGRALVEKGIINEEQLNESLRIQKQTREPLGDILIKLGYLTREDIARTIASTFDLEYIDLDDLDIKEEVLEKISPLLAHRYGILPIRLENSVLHVACDHPPEPQVMGNLRRLVGKQIIVHIGARPILKKLLKEKYEPVESGSITASLSGSRRTSNPLQAAADKEYALEQNIIAFLDGIITEALTHRATDIHFESAKDRLRVRFRVDGMLREVETAPPETIPPLISRIKVLSNLDIAEKRSPQDGSFTYESPYDTVDIRVSILPNIYGEKAVLRLLPLGKMKMNLETLGMEEEIRKDFPLLLKRPHGLILLAGPTGSGKSTTLYASLLKIRQPQVSITTVEDPVEYKIEDVTQVQVDYAQKITFPLALRAILRQDPDIVMIGEIRDKETADIALRASLTGHLVLSTIHTNDAPSALTRLVEMGCEPYLVSSSVIGVLAQRLIRRNCQHCQEAFEPTGAELKRFGLSNLTEGTKWFRGSGCQRCNKTGYRGRIGIFEFLRIDKDIRQEVLKQSPAEVIGEIAVSKGMKTLLEDGILKVNRGLTTPEEVLRVAVLE
jgi:type IV pilus assembly protein PilB